MRSALRIAFVVTLMAAPAVATAIGSPRTYAINCSREQYKPARIIISCGDAGIQLRKLHWTRWTRSEAVGTGDYVANNCTPDCADGKFITRPVKITLFRPKACPGQRHLGFGHAAFSYPDGRLPYFFRRINFLCP